MGKPDAIIIGSGPNGLSAAIRLAQEGLSVQVLEAHQQTGGGTRTAELTLPGFHHDVCSAIHPMGLASPFLSSLPLEDHGLEWIHPDIALAHPFDDGSAAVLDRSVEETASQFDAASAEKYRRIFLPLIGDVDELLSDLLAPPQIPSNPLTVMRFGMQALPSTLEAARMWFSDERCRALLAGNAAHSVVPLDRQLSTNAVGLMLMLVGHAYGWPVAKGGSQRITDAMVNYLQSLGGVVETGRTVTALSELPDATAYLFDTSPSAMAEISGDRLLLNYRKRLNRYRHGPGIFKIDYAMSAPVPWTSNACRRAGTVHVGGTLDEIATSEREAWQGTHSERPFVLTAQQSLSDDSRAPEGQHTFWAYCHVPSGSTVDMTAAIENQIERFAPGFRDCVLGRHTMNCSDYQSYNANLIGGDIVGGVADWRQLLTRPVMSLKPHTTPAEDIFICSASTPPGAGVHGMGGYWAAEEVLRGLAV
tara:strand:- start:2907 stop:4334 length:1428 start_codon:yes stop_codon:yes gene_type:complete